MSIHATKTKENLLDESLSQSQKYTNIYVAEIRKMHKYTPEL